MIVVVVTPLSSSGPHPGEEMLPKEAVHTNSSQTEVTFTGSQGGTGSSGHKLFLLALSWAPTPPLLCLGAVVSCVPQKETGVNGITPTQQDWAPCGFTGKGSLNQSVRRHHFKAPI